MAEPFGIAASAFQVAGAGIALAKTLKTYTDSVRKAERQLKPVADHVKLTADVLTNVGTLLKNEDIRGLYTEELLGSTSDALGGCRTAFEELDKFVSKFLKLNKGAGGKINIQASARFTLYFKQKELDVLQAHLERFKTSLDLVLGVLNLTSSARSAKDTSVIAEMKADITRLIQAEHEAKKKEASLMPTPVESNASMESASSVASRELPAELSNSRALPTVPLMHAMAVGGAAQRSINIDAAPRFVRNATFPHPSTPEDTVLQYLSKCADAAAQLTADIEKAIAKWNDSAEYETECLTDAFQSTTTAMHALARYEQRVSKTKESPPPYVQGIQDRISQEDINAYRGLGHRVRVKAQTQTSQDERLVDPAIIRRQSRSRSYDSRHERRCRRLSRSPSRSRSRPHSRSESRSRKVPAALPDGAVVGGLAGHRIRNRNENETGIVNEILPPRRSRSRRRRESLASLRDDRASNEDGRHHEMDDRNNRIAQAGLSSAAAASIWERTRSRSGDRDRERSGSRTRLHIPIAAAGLGGAAVAGLYEKNKAKKEAKRDEAIDREIRRSRSRSRSWHKSTPSQDADLALPSNGVSLFTPNLDTLDAAESSRVSNPTQDTAFDSVTCGDFSLNESGECHSDPDHGPRVSPYLPPPPTIVTSTREIYSNVSAAPIYICCYQAESKDISSTLAELFLSLGDQNGPNIMSPPVDRNGFAHDEKVAAPWEAPYSWAVSKIDANNDCVEKFNERGDMEQWVPVEVDELLRQWTTLKI